MARMNVGEAVRSALACEMARDDRVVLLGEEIALGGAFRATEGLRARFGEERVMDLPSGEGGLVGASIGMALYGLRPVAEIQLADFVLPAFDQIVDELAVYRWRSGGELSTPVVVRAPYGGGVRGGHHHSRSPEALFAHVPGLDVVVPSTPGDAKGLLSAAIRGEDPVLFFEPKRLYRGDREEVPDEAYVVPIGEARLVRPGRQVTLLAWGAMVLECERAARLAGARGWDVEVIDLRSLAPLDVAAIEKSVKKTGRLVIVHEAPRTCGFGAELSALVAERWIERLEAPILRVTGFDTPYPYTNEEAYLPDPPRILAAVEEAVRF